MGFAGGSFEFVGVIIGSPGGDAGLAKSPAFGLSRTGSVVLAGGSTGSVGEFAGLATVVEGVACLSGTVVGWTSLGAGVEAIIGISPDPRVNAIGASNRRIVPSPS